MSDNKQHRVKADWATGESSWHNWLQRAAIELKLSDPGELIATDWEGIVRAPFYSADGPFAVAHTPEVEKQSEHTWMAVAPISGQDAAAVNARALHALQHGAESILPDFSAFSPADLPVCLQGILPQYAPLYAEGISADALNSGILAWVEQEKIPPGSVRGALLHDALELLSWDDNTWKETHARYSGTLPEFHPFGVNTAHWRARGLSATEETALVWLCLYRCLSHRNNDRMNVGAISPISIQFPVSVGCSTEFFDELARLRALREGLQRVASLFTGTNPAELNLRIHPMIMVRVVPDMLCSEDTHTNLLRLTTMGISGILGGCDALCLSPFDPTDNADGFADELSLHMQMILRHEAFPQVPEDAGKGSHYIEYLSEAMGNRAWTILGNMVDLCTQGGSWNPGKIEEQLDDWCRAGEARMGQVRASGKRIRVGVDRYRIEVPDQQQGNPL